jgi:hypothetical protein
MVLKVGKELRLILEESRESSTILKEERAYEQYTEQDIPGRQGAKQIKQGGNKNRILYDGVGHHSIFL